MRASTVERKIAARENRNRKIFWDYATIPGATLREVADKYRLSHQRVFQIVQEVNDALIDNFGISSLDRRGDMTKRCRDSLHRHLGNLFQ
jgi:hypothetical protein